MKYFGKKVRIGQLEVDESTVSAKSAAVQNRLDRISDNYARLNEVLVDLEDKITNNDYLKAKREQEQAALVAKQEAMALKQGAESETAVSADPKKPR